VLPDTCYPCLADLPRRFQLNAPLNKVRRHPRKLTMHWILSNLKILSKICNFSCWALWTLSSLPPQCPEFGRDLPSTSGFLCRFTLNFARRVCSTIVTRSTHTIPSKATLTIHSWTTRTSRRSSKKRTFPSKHRYWGQLVALGDKIV
jgi:hypothetical protein